MSPACLMPDSSLGIALRIADYADCQARVLGENGFQTLIGGEFRTGLLLGLVTIFVALIGYRLLLGGRLDAGEGIVRIMRLGIVLALVTAWPAFQTLVYQVAVDGPRDVAEAVMPAAGLPSDDLSGRVQAAYDAMRLGYVAAAAPAADPADGAAAPAGSQAMAPAQPGLDALPQTASLFVTTTIAITAAFRLATGFLLAVAPFALLGLLFDATIGLMNGWLRALAGAMLATLAATIVTAVALVTVEGELAHLQLYRQGSPVTAIDGQALPTMVLAQAAMMLVAVLLALRMANAIRLPGFAGGGRDAEQRRAAPDVRSSTAEATRHPAPLVTQTVAPTRATAIAHSLSMAVRRESRGGDLSDPPVPRAIGLRDGDRAMAEPREAPIGITGRRSVPKPTRSAARRDTV